MKGAIYEPLVVATVAGGGHVYPWLAQSWKWSNGNKTLTLQIAAERQVVGRQAADRRRRRLQPHGRQAGQGDGHHRPLPRRHEHRLDQARRAERRRDHAEDAGLAVHRRQPEPAVRRAEAHLVEGREARRRSRTRTRSARARSPRSRGSRRRTSCSTRTRRYWKAGSPKVPCLEYIEATSNDAALLADPERQGRLDAQLRAERRDRRTIAKDPAHYHAFYATTAYPLSLMFDTTQYPYSLVPFRQAVSMAINRDDVSKLGEYGYAPPTDAIGLSGSSRVGHRSGDQGRGQAPRDLQPGAPRSCSRTTASRTTATS